MFKRYMKNMSELLRTNGRRKLIGIVLSTASVSAIAASPPEQEKLASANAEFTFALLQKVAQEQPATNIFISPYSASTVLEMIGNGAAGKTREEMERVLGTSGMPMAILNRACKEADA